MTMPEMSASTAHFSCEVKIGENIEWRSIYSTKATFNDKKHLNTGWSIDTVFRAHRDLSMHLATRIVVTYDDGKNMILIDDGGSWA